MKVTIDRIEGRYAIVELDDRSTVDMPLSLLPDGAVEGDILEIILNKRETENRKVKIEKLCEDMWE